MVWSDPTMIMDLITVNDNRAIPRSGGKEPGRETFWPAFRRGPVRNASELARGNEQSGLFVGFAHGGTTCRGEYIVLCPSHIIFRIDSSPGNTQAPPWNES